MMAEDLSIGLQIRYEVRQGVKGVQVDGKPAQGATKQDAPVRLMDKLQL